MSPFEIQGFEGVMDDRDYLRNYLLGGTPYDETPESFQASAPQMPELASGLLTNGLSIEDLLGTSTNLAAQMGQTGANTGGGQSRIANQMSANQQALSNKGGGLLGTLMKIGANVAMGNWIGGMFPKKR